MSSHFSIFCQLIRRDLLLFKKNLRSVLINTVILVTSQSLTIGILFPRLGMPEPFIASFFAGSVTLLMMIVMGFTRVFTFARTIAYEHGSTTSYHLTLPIATKWLFASYIISFVIETLLLSIFAFMLSLYILHSHVLATINFTIQSILTFICINAVSLTFIAVFFYALALIMPFHWFAENIWPRILSPLFFFSPNPYRWHALHSFSPIASYLFLLNPLTYATEGMRTALLQNTTGYLPLPLCLIMLVFFIAGSCLLLKKGIQKKLDTIWG